MYGANLVQSVVEMATVRGTEGFASVLCVPALDVSLVCP